jgi:hypothetical protein
MADSTDLNIAIKDLRTVTEDLISEHGYREVRNGHSIDSCQTCKNIYTALMTACCYGSGEADPEPWYPNASIDQLREVVVEQALTTADAAEDLEWDDLRELLENHFRPHGSRNY